MVSDYELNLAMSNKKVVSLKIVVKSVEQIVYFVQGLQRKKSSLD